jgi:hypothetical protein
MCFVPNSREQYTLLGQSESLIVLWLKFGFHPCTSSRRINVSARRIGAAPAGVRPPKGLVSVMLRLGHAPTLIASF